MAKVELIIPKMGESVSEATIITWAKEIGDVVEIDETIIEIATDKVDSEVPSTHEGKLLEKLVNIDEVVYTDALYICRFGRSIARACKSGSIGLFIKGK